MKFIFVTLFFTFTWGVYSNPNLVDKVNYYEDLITTEIDRANNYQLPTNNEQYRPRSPIIQHFGTWDFIIVGAGCGGAVVANRLSEVQEWKVLLIEAGGSETDFSVIPAMHIYLHMSRFNWGYYSTSQKHACLGMHENRCPIVRGRALGGSSALNYACYSRANRENYDRWAEEGNSGWSYDEILPYFIKSENSQVDGDPGYHGRDGYWNVKYEQPLGKQFLDFIEGSKIIHNASSTDYNGRDELGAFQIQLNNIQEFRDSSNNAFLKPVMNRKNLKIITNAYVTKVLVNPFTKNAFGVEFAKDGKRYSARASMEVILSAGAINTPQILMLSGIGPRKHLAQMNIPLISDLPVGKTLYDHGLFYGAFIGTNFTEPDLSLRQQIVNFLHDSGPLTLYSNIEAIGFYQTKFETDPNYPDLEMIVSLADLQDILYVRDLRLKNQTYQAIINSFKNFQSTLNVFQFILKAQSVGSVTLKSADPYQYPNIDPNILAKQNDVEILYQGIQIIKKILRTEPLKRINATLILVDYPQCRNHELGSKNYWICAFRLMTSIGLHQCGTCKMGPDPKTSVVNNKGTVHGFENLRIVDSSIFPSVVGGHTAAPTIMMAERISDFIKLQYGKHIQPITNTIY